MKEIIPQLLANLLRIYVQEEVPITSGFDFVILFFSSGVYKYVFLYAARSELGEFVEYDLDNEDDDWLYEFDKDNKELSPEK